MTYWVRSFHNPHSKQHFEVTSDERYLPQLRNRIVRELHADPKWDDESIYVHQPDLDHQVEGAHPEITLREI